MSDPIVSEILELAGDPIGGASGPKRLFNVRFLGKSGNSDLPYTVANELVATELGHLLGLNLPGVLSHAIGDETLVLIKMAGRDSRMGSQPATARALAEYVRRHPDEVHGSIVFDLFVANNDRAFAPERRNFTLDEDGRLMLYDQGNACFYRPRPAAGIRAGVDRLDAVDSSLEALFDMDHKGNYYRELLSDWSLVRRWCDRIARIPDFMIEAIIDRIPRQLPHPSVKERERLRDFLLARRSTLFDRIVGARHRFPGLIAEAP